MSINAYQSNSMRLFNQYTYEWWWHHFSGTDIEGNIHHFFLEFFVMNPQLNTIDPAFYPDKPCYLMIKGGMWPSKYNKGLQINSFLPISKLIVLSTKNLNIRFDDIIINERHLKGKFSNRDKPSRQNLFSDIGTMEFDLHIHKKNPFDVGYATNTISRFMNLFDMFWYVRSTNAQYNGHIILNNKKYFIHSDTSFGYQDKNWGRNFSNPWLWISSSCICEDNGHLLKNASMVCGGTHPSILNKGIGDKNNILLYVYLSPKEIYEFNFTKFDDGKIKWKVKKSKKYFYWFITFKKTDLSISLQIKHEINHLMNIHYENPYGQYVFKNLLNGGNGSGYMYINKKKYMLFHCGCEFGKHV